MARKEIAKKKKGEVFKTKHKHKLFIKAYLNNGLNATEAYRKVYKRVDKTRDEEEVTQKMASRLLSNVGVVNILCKELEAIELDINAKYVLTEAIKILQADDTGKRERLKALDLISTIIGAKRPENTTQIAIFSDVEGRLKDIIANRLHNAQGEDEDD